MNIHTSVLVDKSFEMPTVAVTNFNIVCATLGGFISCFGLVSYLCKERFYLSEALISMLFGVIFSPHATNFIKPLQYAGGSQEGLSSITLYFCRLVLGIQLVLAGVQLPSRYLIQERKSLLMLLGPGLTVMWISSSLLVWALVPNFSFLHALAVGACVTPTDPILSNSIVKGKFADKNIPKGLQNIIIAESGANDGLGYPFLFLALYLIKYTGDSGAGQSGGARLAIGLWFGETWGYTIILSIIYGIVVGWIAKDLLHWAEEKKYVDKESFLVFAITLAVRKFKIHFTIADLVFQLFIVGTCGMIGSDDVLACFVAGNVFTIEYVTMGLIRKILTNHKVIGFDWRHSMIHCSLQLTCSSISRSFCGLVQCVHGDHSFATITFRSTDLSSLVFLYYFSDVCLLSLRCTGKSSR